MDNNAIVQDKMLLNDLRGLVTDVIKETTADMVRRKKMYVTQGVHSDANGNKVISVQEAFSDPFEVPYVPDLYNVQAGDSVWVEWAYGLGNACAVNTGSWKNTFIDADDNGVSLHLNDIQVTGHIGGDIVNTQDAASVTVSGKIQDAIDSLGKHLNGDVNIAVPAGTYVEDPNISGFEGNGTLTLSFDKEAVVKGDWVIAGNHRVVITGATDGTDTTEFIGVLEDSVIDVCGTRYLKINGVEMHGVERAAGDSGQAYGVYVRDGSYAYLTDCLIDRAGTAVYVEHAHLDIKDCKGGYNSTDETTVANLVNGIVISADGGYVNAKGTIPAGPVAGDTGYEDNGYPFTCSGTVTPTLSGGTAPPVVTEVTATWTASAGYYCNSYKTGTDSYDGRGTGWKGDGTFNLRMGYNTGTQKHMAGLWIFSDADTIRQTLENATIKKATVSMTRTAANGSSSGTVIKPYYHNLTAATVSNYAGRCDPWNISAQDTDVYTDCGCDAQYIALSGTGTFELPSAMYDLLKDGTVKGFGIGMNHPGYFFMFGPTSCVLTVTYDA